MISTAWPKVSYLCHFCIGPMLERYTAQSNKKTLACLWHWEPHAQTFYHFSLSHSLSLPLSLSLFLSFLNKLILCPNQITFNQTVSENLWSKLKDKKVDFLPGKFVVENSGFFFCSGEIQHFFSSRKHWVSVEALSDWSAQIFFEGCHHSGGSFTY